MQLVHRIQNGRPLAGALWTGCWYIVAVVLIVLAPNAIRHGQPLWNLPPAGIAQSLAMGVCFLVVALCVR
ncbi:MAG: hypothetical protein ACREOG_22130, partial [Gemmatimonadaceae bacterium]